MKGCENKDVAVVIFGDPGSGKSILARHLRRFAPYAEVLEWRTQKGEDNSLTESVRRSTAVHEASFAFAIEWPKDGENRRILRIIKSRTGNFQDIARVQFACTSRDGDVDFNPEVFIKSKDFVG